MHKLLALTLLPGLLLTGCPPEHGGYTGGGDRILLRGSDAGLLLCENGGYVAMLSNGHFDGRYIKHEHAPDGTGVIGDTGARLFSLLFAADGTTAVGDGLLAGTWTEDNTRLDQGTVQQCTSLELRDWWLGSGTTLPVATAFAKAPDAYANWVECLAAQTRGEVPAGALCEDQILLCPDGSVQMNSGVTTLGAPAALGSYTAEAGIVSVQPLDNNAFTAFSGVYAFDRTLTTNGAEGGTGTFAWRWIYTDSLANGLSCR